MLGKYHCDVRVVGTLIVLQVCFNFSNESLARGWQLNDICTEKIFSIQQNMKIQEFTEDTKFCQLKVLKIYKVLEKINNIRKHYGKTCFQFSVFGIL